MVDDGTEHTDEELTDPDTGAGGHTDIDVDVDEGEQGEDGDGDGGAELEASESGAESPGFDDDCVIDREAEQLGQV